MDGRRGGGRRKTGVCEMRKYVLALGAMAAAAAFPGSASAATDCSHAEDGVGAGGLVVYAEGGGLSGDAEEVVGVCADGLPTGPQLTGGTVEAGTGGPGEVYVVVDGDDANTGGAGQAGGYVGVSTFESQDKDPDCDGNDEGTGTNSGDCVTLRNLPVVGTVSAPVPGVVCGNTSGKAWDDSQRDGCQIP